MQITDTLLFQDSKGSAKKQEVYASMFWGPWKVLRSVAEIDVDYKDTACQREVAIFLYSRVKFALFCEVRLS